MAVSKKKKASAPKKSAAKSSASKKSAPKKVNAKKTAPQKKVTAKAKTPAQKSTAQPVLAKMTKTPVNKTPNKTTADFSKFFSPLDDRILVDALPTETVTEGGLFIPEMAQEKQSRGVVIAVGPGKRNKKAQLRPLDVQMGDKIIYAQYAGTTIEVQGQEVTILREDEVLAILVK